MSGKFIKIKCADCGNEQIGFDRAATVVTCRTCGAVLIVPKGGKCEVKGEITEVVN